MFLDQPRVCGAGSWGPGGALEGTACPTNLCDWCSWQLLAPPWGSITPGTPAGWRGGKANTGHAGTGGHRGAPVGMVVGWGVRARSSTRDDWGGSGQYTGRPPLLSLTHQYWGRWGALGEKEEKYPYALPMNTHTLPLIPVLLFLLWRHECPDLKRCCDTHSICAYPKCPPLLAGDRRTEQQHGYCTPEQLDYNVCEWVCSAGTYRYTRFH